ncbi:hypothetical protein [Spirosoma montaniterrae]|uniref:Uncharacterized protein n=1 Tax=Spirosoma montaniterrae TaxID=1178516 RepID=A0A1P9WW36_9BACT|nr:hypothetical protein [Spirosoma montaniterrae]AQG79605.1 hypothetical protein AWR27_09875 [Spirosoma montaniterrae]
MPIRPLIVALLWLTYVLSLGHSLLPHHHHRNAGCDDHEGQIAHHHAGAKHHHDRTADRSDHDHDHDSKEASDEADWWFGHQHTPGVEFSQLTASDQYQAPVAAELTAVTLPRFAVVIRWVGQTVGWPPTQAKAPPVPYRFRPLRAPPLFSLPA